MSAVHNSMVRVCHVTSVHSATDVRILHKECVSLAAAGYNVSLVAPGAKDFEYQGVKILFVQPEKNSRRYRMFAFTKKVIAKALTTKAQIYHLHDPELLRFSSKLRRSGAKVVYDAHEDLPRQILSKYWIWKPIRSIMSLFAEAYENKHARKAAMVVTATPTIKERYSRVNIKTIDVNNFPRLEDFLQVQPNYDGKSICYVGGIMKIRGNTVLLQALDRVPEAKLILAGVYSPETYREELKEMKGWAQVEECGFLDRKGIADVFSRSGAGVVTLLPIQNYLVSLPVKMFEYMAAGLPVIASDFPLWKEIIEKNNAGICVNPEDPDSISHAIQSLLDNPTASEQMGQKGRKLVLEKYNWAIEEKKLLTGYRLLMQE